MTTVSVYDARASFSRLIDRALAGEDIVITKNGKATVRLVPVAEDAKPARRPLGVLAGEFDIPDEVLLAPLPDDFLAAFYGEDEPAQDQEKPAEGAGGRR